MHEVSEQAVLQSGAPHPLPKQQRPGQRHSAPAGTGSGAYSTAYQCLCTPPGAPGLRAMFKEGSLPACFPTCPKQGQAWDPQLPAHTAAGARSQLRWLYDAIPLWGTAVVPVQSCPLLGALGCHTDQGLDTPCLHVSGTGSCAVDGHTGPPTPIGASQECLPCCRGIATSANAAQLERHGNYRQHTMSIV